MFRIVLIVVASIAAGLGLGRVQSSVMNSGVEERFTGSRTTLAEQRGEMTREEVIAVTSSGTPKLEIEGGAEFDFGMMQHGDTLSHEFLFRNIGDAPLSLEMGSSTCKCTVGDLTDSVLEPGEETLVKLTWTAKTIMPQFGQSATIHTTDPQKSEVQLTVKGQIADSFVVEPRELTFGNISVTEPAEKSFYIFGYLDEASELDRLAWTDTKTAHLVSMVHEAVEVDAKAFPQHSNAKQAFKVTVSIKPGLSLGPLSARVQFTTDQGDNIGILDLPVTGYVSGELALLGGSSFNPKMNMVKLGTVSSNKGASVSILLAVQGENRDRIIPEIESLVPEESLKVTLGEPTERGNRITYPIRFEVPRGAPPVYYPGNSSTTFGKILIKTTGSSTQELPLFVRLVIED